MKRYWSFPRPEMGLTTKIASTRQERLEAYELVYRLYRTRRYVDAQSGRIVYHEAFGLPSSSTLIAQTASARVAGTLTVVGDSPLGLQLDETYPLEVQALRDKGRNVAEVTCLRIEPHKAFRPREMFFALTKFMIQHACFAKYDDLLFAIKTRLSGEIRKRNPELTPEQVSHTAKVISSGALRYYMLRFARNRVVAFDLDSALAFEGETGPYIQYAVVRARKILEKVAARFGSETTTGPALATTAELDALPADSVAEHWRLVQLLLRIPPTLEAAVESLELSQVAKHAHHLAQTFNSFYHRFPVMKEEQAVVRITRVALVRLFHDGMVDLLGLMGIKVPERM
jgi:hypothetical protein